MTATTTAGRKYAIDPSHSSVHFSVRHMMISKVRDTFHTIAGTVDVPSGSPIPSAVSVTIDASSIETREAQRDAHLKSPDFLDVEKFPQLTFASTAVRATGDASFELTGDLTIHGTTRSITAKATVEGQGKDPWGNDRIAYEAGGVLVGDEIDVTLDIETVPAQ